MSIQDRVTHGAAVAKWKIDQQKRLLSLQSEINELRGLIRNRKVRLSDTALALFAQDQLKETELVDICTEIKDLNTQIEIKETEVDFVKKEKPPDLNIQSSKVPRPTGLFCPECDKPLVGRFCPEHGIEGIQHESRDLSEENGETKEQQLYCPKCGKSVPIRFCPEDGVEGILK